MLYMAVSKLPNEVINYIEIHDIIIEAKVYITNVAQLFSMNCR